jgi:hypothetical protein
MGSVDISLPHRSLKLLMKILKNKQFPINVRHITFASIIDRQYGGGLKEGHSDNELEEEKEIEQDENFDFQHEDEENTNENHRVSYHINGN